MNKSKVMKAFSEYGIFLALLIIMVGFSLTTDVFLTKTNLLNICRQVSMVGIASTGFIFVLLLGGIDLSIGSQITLANILMGVLINYTNISSLWVIFLIGILMHLLCGLLNGLLITKVKMPPLIVTLSTMTILEGAAYLICRGKPIYGFPENVKTLGQGFVGIIPIPVIIMVIMFAICSFALNKTYIGRYFYAVGGNREASKLSGINVDRIEILGYILSALGAAVAGIIILSRTNSAQPSAGSGFEFDVITATVLGGVSVNGGVGKVSCMIAGVLIIGVLNNGLVLINLDSYAQMVVKGIVLILAVGYDCLQKERAKSGKMAVTTG